MIPLQRLHLQITQIDTLYQNLIKMKLDVIQLFFGFNIVEIYN